MTVKICDFGLSRYKREAEAAAYTHVGTAFWAAPEMIRHDEYTEKADVYSFAIVLWELICKKDPYEGIPAVQVPFRVADKGLRPDFPENYHNQGLLKLMVNCWDDDPEKRLNFSMIVEELQDLQNDVIWINEAAKDGINDTELMTTQVAFGEIGDEKDDDLAVMVDDAESLALLSDASLDAEVAMRGGKSSTVARYDVEQGSLKGEERGSSAPARRTSLLLSKEENKKELSAEERVVVVQLLTMLLAVVILFAQTHMKLFFRRLVVIKNIFDAIDDDGSGSLDFSELETFLSQASKALGGMGSGVVGGIIEQRIGAGASADEVSFSDFCKYLLVLKNAGSGNSFNMYVKKLNTIVATMNSIEGSGDGATPGSASLIMPVDLGKIDRKKRHSTARSSKPSPLAIQAMRKDEGEQRQPETV